MPLKIINSICTRTPNLNSLSSGETFVRRFPPSNSCHSEGDVYMTLDNTSRLFNHDHTEQSDRRICLNLTTGKLCHLSTCKEFSLVEVECKVFHGGQR